MKELLTMTNRELDKLQVIRKILEHRLTWNQGAKLLNLCRAQIGTLCIRVRLEGAKGLIHRLRGKTSNHRLDPKILERAVAILRQPLYAGFGPTFANEKLRRAPHHLMLSTPLLRRGMIAGGLWKAHRKGSRH